MLRRLVVAIVLLNAGWMAFDGARALVAGDYTTPATGPYAGQLGPWAALLEAVGLAPRSTPVKAAFVVYGLAAGAAALAYAFRRAGSRRMLLVLLPLGLWYLPFGTLINLVAIAWLWWSGRRNGNAE